MIPVIAIIGRPNVGKSTLFNRLTRSQQALVLDQPGVTRDRQFGQGERFDRSYIVIDTGGIVEHPDGLIETALVKQSLQAIQEADVIFLIVDGRNGLTPMDSQLAKMLRKEQKNIIVVVNKVDGLQPEIAVSEFARLGFESIVPIAASQNWGIDQLMKQAFQAFPLNEQAPMVETQDQLVPKVAVIGRPNVGKSTLVNRMLGEERVIVCDYPGTTRDSIYISMERHGKLYTLIDTAGVRRRKNVFEALEKFSVIKTLQAVKDANVVLLVFDAREGLTDQELTLIDFTIDAGRGLIICANKWDGMSSDEREQVKTQLKYRLRFAEFAPIHFISALHGTGVGKLFGVIDTVHQSGSIELTTTQVSDLLTKAVIAHPPPMVQGRQIKLRYAHCGGHHPPTIIIHGNQTDCLPQSYARYLAKFYMKALKLTGTPIRIICRSGDNPYKDKPNVLTKRQVRKRQRLMKFVKKKAKRN
ncbi:MAG: ribosome biogenesis GTPase Der [Candidatus Berkiellales bacterium]